MIGDKLKEIKNKEIKKSSRDIIEQLQLTYETKQEFYIKSSKRGF